MTITTAPTRNEYTATAGQTVFTYTFKIFQDTDLNVYVTPAGQEANDITDLVTPTSVTGVGDENGGTVTISATSESDLVTIVSNIPSNRVIDYQNNGDFRPPVVNSDFDRVVSLVKQVEDIAGRTVAFSESLQNAQKLILPNPEALQLMRWRADLGGLENFSAEPPVFDDFVNSIAGLRAIDPGTATTGTQIKVSGYFAAGDGGGGQFYWDASSTETDNDGTIVKVTSVTTGRWKRITTDPVMLEWFGVTGTGDDTDAFKNALAAYPDGANFSCGFLNLTFSATLAIPENIHLDMGGSTVAFDARGATNIQFGFLMGSNTSIKNISQGHIIFDYVLYDNFITCGLFYGVGNTNRGEYIGSVPDIASISDTSAWDAPTDIDISNVHSDISGIAHNDSDTFGSSFVFLSNFVKRISISNVTAKGLATFTDYAASYVTTTGGVLDDSNYFNAVRFEWGNFVTPKANASGESIIVNNVYGEGLRLQNHSAVVSMGNAHSFEVSNISGKDTGQIFYCGASGTSAEQADGTRPFTMSMRSVKNIKGEGLYVWDEAGHLCAGIKVDDIWDNTTALTPHTSLSINGFNLIGRDEDVGAPTKYPGYGIVLGDSTWSVDTRFVNIKNGRASKFSNGSLYSDARNITTENVTYSYNGSRGVSISSSALVQSRLKFTNCYFIHNNLDGAVDYGTNLGVGATIFRGMGIVFNDCTFGDGDLPVGSETQLHSVFLRDGEVRNIVFRDCSFPNYESASSYDIWSNSAAITYKVDNCVGSIESDGRLRTNRIDIGYGLDLLATGKFNFSGSVLNQSNVLNGSMVRVSTGRYRFDFDKSTINDAYFVVPIPSGDTATHDYRVNYSNLNTASFEILVRNSTGTLTDPSSATQDIGFVVLKSNKIVQQINL